MVSKANAAGGGGGRRALAGGVPALPPAIAAGGSFAEGNNNVERGNRLALPQPKPNFSHGHNNQHPYGNGIGGGSTKTSSASPSSSSISVDDEYCPQCGTQYNTSNYRKVTESCGHSKCRRCIIMSEDGCKECTQGDLMERVDPPFNNHFEVQHPQQSSRGRQQQNAQQQQNNRTVTTRRTTAAARLQSATNSRANSLNSGRPTSTSSPGSISNDTVASGRPVQSTSAYSDSGASEPDSCLRFPVMGGGGGVVEVVNDGYAATIDFDTMAELTSPSSSGFLDFNPADSKSFPSILDEESDFSKGLMSLRKMSEPINNNSSSSGNSAGNGVPSSSAALGTNAGVANRTKELPAVRFVYKPKSPSPAASAPIKSETPTSSTSSSPQTRASVGKRRSTRDSPVRGSAVAATAEQENLKMAGGRSPDITQGVPKEIPKASSRMPKVTTPTTTAAASSTVDTSSKLSALLTRPTNSNAASTSSPEGISKNTRAASAATAQQQQSSKDGQNEGKIEKSTASPVPSHSKPAGTSVTSSPSKSDADRSLPSPAAEESSSSSTSSPKDNRDEPGSPKPSTSTGGPTGPLRSTDGEPVKKKKKRSPVVIHDHITVLGGDPLMYQCNICNKKFKTKAHIKYHEFCREQDKPFKCETCGQGFIAKSHYEYHLRTHTGERPYVCPKCGKGFNQRGKVTRHMRSHTGEKPFVCQECNRGFANAQALRCHTLIHTGERPFACTYCNKRFTGMTNLKKHVITHTGERPFSCPHCGKSFGLKWTLDLHLRTHSSERPYACDQCSRAFSNSKDLRRHLVIHSGEKPFKCWICGTAFRRKDNLDRHIKNTHNQSKDVAKQLANEAAAEYLKTTLNNQNITNIPVSKVNSVVISNIIKNSNLMPANVPTSSKKLANQNVAGPSNAPGTSASSMPPTRSIPVRILPRTEPMPGPSSAMYRQGNTGGPIIIASTSLASSTAKPPQSVQRELRRHNPPSTSSAASTVPPTTIVVKSPRKVIITAPLSPPTTRGLKAKKTEEEAKKKGKKGKSPKSPEKEPDHPTLPEDNSKKKRGRPSRNKQNEEEVPSTSSAAAEETFTVPTPTLQLVCVEPTVSPPPPQLTPEPKERPKKKKKGKKSKKNKSKKDKGNKSKVVSSIPSASLPTPSTNQASTAPIQPTVARVASPPVQVDFSTSPKKSRKKKSHGRRKKKDNHHRHHQNHVKENDDVKVEEEQPTTPSISSNPPCETSTLNFGDLLELGVERRPTLTLVTISSPVYEPEVPSVTILLEQQTEQEQRDKDCDSDMPEQKEDVRRDQPQEIECILPHDIEDFEEDHVNHEEDDDEADMSKEEQTLAQTQVQNDSFDMVEDGGEEEETTPADISIPSTIDEAEEMEMDEIRIETKGTADLSPVTTALPPEPICNEEEEENEAMEHDDELLQTDQLQVDEGVEHSHSNEIATTSDMEDKPGSPQDVKVLVNDAKEPEQSVPIVSEPCDDESSKDFEKAMQEDEEEEVEEEEEGEIREETDQEQDGNDALLCTVGAPDDEDPDDEDRKKSPSPPPNHPLPQWGLSYFQNSIRSRASSIEAEKKKALTLSQNEEDEQKENSTFDKPSSPSLPIIISVSSTAPEPEDEEPKNADEPVPSSLPTDISEFVLSQTEEEGTIAQEKDKDNDQLSDGSADEERDDLESISSGSLPSSEQGDVDDLMDDEEKSESNIEPETEEVEMTKEPEVEKASSPLNKQKETIPDAEICSTDQIESQDKVEEGEMKILEPSSIPSPPADSPDKPDEVETETTKEFEEMEEETTETVSKEVEEILEEGPSVMENSEETGVHEDTEMVGKDDVGNESELMNEEVAKVLDDVTAEVSNKAILVEEESVALQENEENDIYDDNSEDEREDCQMPDEEEEVFKPMNQDEDTTQVVEPETIDSETAVVKEELEEDLKEENTSQETLPVSSDGIDKAEETEENAVDIKIQCNVSAEEISEQVEKILRRIVVEEEDMPETEKDVEQDSLEVGNESKDDKESVKDIPLQSSEVIKDEERHDQENEEICQEKQNIESVPISLELPPEDKEELDDANDETVIIDTSKEELDQSEPETVPVSVVEAEEKEEESEDEDKMEIVEDNHSEEDKAIEGSPLPAALPASPEVATSAANEAEEIEEPVEKEEEVVATKSQPSPILPPTEEEVEEEKTDHEEQNDDAHSVKVDDDDRMMDCDYNNEPPISQSPPHHSTLEQAIPEKPAPEEKRTLQRHSPIIPTRDVSPVVEARIESRSIPHDIDSDEWKFPTPRLILVRHESSPSPSPSPPDSPPAQQETKEVEEKESEKIIENEEEMPEKSDMIQEEESDEYDDDDRLLIDESYNSPQVDTSGKAGTVEDIVEEEKVEEVEEEKDDEEEDGKEEEPLPVEQDKECTQSPIVAEVRESPTPVLSTNEETVTNSPRAESPAHSPVAVIHEDSNSRDIPIESRSDAPLPPDISEFILSVLENKGDHHHHDHHHHVKKPEDLESISSESLGSPASVENDIRNCIKALESSDEDEQDEDDGTIRNNSDMVCIAKNEERDGQKEQFEVPKERSIEMNRVEATSAPIPTTASLVVSLPSLLHAEPKTTLVATTAHASNKAGEIVSGRPMRTLSAGEKKEFVPAKSQEETVNRLKSQSPPIPNEGVTSLPQAHSIPQQLITVQQAVRSPQEQLTPVSSSSIMTGTKPTLAPSPSKLSSNFSEDTRQMPNAALSQPNQNHVNYEKIYERMASQSAPGSCNVSSLLPSAPIPVTKEAVVKVVPESKLSPPPVPQQKLPSPPPPQQPKHQQPSAQSVSSYDSISAPLQQQKRVNENPISICSTPQLQLVTAAAVVSPPPPPAPVEKIVEHHKKEFIPTSNDLSRVRVNGMVNSQVLPQQLQKHPSPPPTPAVATVPVSTPQPPPSIPTPSKQKSHQQQQRVSIKRPREQELEVSQSSSPSLHPSLHSFPTRVQFILPDGHHHQPQYQNSSNHILPEQQQSPHQQQIQPTAVAYDPSLLHFLHQDGQPALEGNYKLVYAAAAATAERDEGVLDGPPNKVRLLYAEALGVGPNAQNENELQFYYAATAPDQHVRQSQDNTASHIQLMEPYRVVYTREGETPTSEVLQYGVQHLPENLSQQHQQQQNQQQVLNLSVSSTSPVYYYSNFNHSDNNGGGSSLSSSPLSSCSNSSSPFLQPDQQQQQQQARHPAYHDHGTYLSTSTAKLMMTNPSAYQNNSQQQQPQLGYSAMNGHVQDLSGRKRLELPVHTQREDRISYAHVQSDDPIQYAELLGKARQMKHVFPQGALRHCHPSALTGGEFGGINGTSQNYNAYYHQQQQQQVKVVEQMNGVTKVNSMPLGSTGVNGDVHINGQGANNTGSSKARRGLDLLTGALAHVGDLSYETTQPQPSRTATAAAESLAHLKDLQFESQQVARAAAAIAAVGEMAREKRRRQQEAMLGQQEAIAPPVPHVHQQQQPRHQAPPIQLQQSSNNPPHMEPPVTSNSSYPQQQQQWWSGSPPSNSNGSSSSSSSISSSGSIRDNTQQSTPPYTFHEIPIIPVSQAMMGTSLNYQHLQNPQIRQPRLSSVVATGSLAPTSRQQPRQLLNPVEACPRQGLESMEIDHEARIRRGPRKHYLNRFGNLDGN